MSDYGNNLDLDSGACIDDGLRRDRDAAWALAKQGWTTPPWFVPGETIELLGSGDPADIDARFVRMYHDDAYGRLTSLRQALLNWSQFSRWRQLLTQVDGAYARGEYAIAVPALLTVLEGVLMDGCGNKTGVISAVNERVRQEDPDSIFGWIWEAVGRFVREVYARSDFSGERPLVLNRHWILHGRDAAEWEEADCLRLMQAIEVVTTLEADKPV